MDHRNRLVAVACVHVAAVHGLLAFEPPLMNDPASSQAIKREPAIEEFGGIWKSLDRERMNPLVNVYPLEPKLKLGDDSLGFGNKQDLTRYLDEIQPTMLEVMRVAARDPEQFGAPPSDSDENPNAHMEYPRAWVQNFERLLSADASWKWENGDAIAAADRIAAIFQLAQWLFVQQGDANAPTLAVGMLNRNCKHFNAMLDDGMDKAMSSEAKSKMLDAMSRIERQDPGHLLQNWERAARRNVEWFREKFLGESGAKEYAQYLREYGILSGAIADLSKFDAKAAEIWREIEGLVPEKDFADKAIALTKEQLAVATDESERLVAPFAEAIRTEDVNAVRTLSKTIAADPTQVARCIIGPVVPTLQLSQSARQSLAEVARRISENAK